MRPTTLVLSAALFLGSTAAAQPGPELDASLRRLGPKQADEVLWLARCIYSESDRPHEQRLVAWVVRNRVETNFRGSTYRDVVLETRQFSAFNEPTPRRTRILGLTPSSTYGPWQTALGIALDVYQAPVSERPFPVTVRHFYSPVSMVGRLKPEWADTGVELSSARLGVDPFRFRFYDGVDEGAQVASRETESVESEGRSERGGFLFPVKRRSGRIARPVRPSVRRTTSP